MGDYLRPISFANLHTNLALVPSADTLLAFVLHAVVMTTETGHRKRTFNEMSLFLFGELT